MMTPFEEKTRLGGALDQIGIRLLALLLCVLWFFRLWGQPLPAILAGTSLTILLLMTGALWQRKQLAGREHALRARIGGQLAMEGLLLMPQAQATLQCAQWLQTRYPLDTIAPLGDHIFAQAGGESLLLLLKQAYPGSKLNEDDVLAAQRALKATQEAQRCVLMTTGEIGPKAAQLSQQLDPPVRLIAGAELRQLAGKCHPASDEQLVAMGKAMRKPFSWQALKPVVFSPAKQARYALYGMGLMVLYIVTGRLYYLIPAGLCLLLAIFSHRQRRKPKRL